MTQENLTSKEDIVRELRRMGGLYVGPNVFDTAADMLAGLAHEPRAELPKPVNHDLWRHMHDEHGLTLLQSELDEILRHAQPACEGCAKGWPFDSDVNAHQDPNSSFAVECTKGLVPRPCGCVGPKSCEKCEPDDLIGYLEEIEPKMRREAKSLWAEGVRMAINRIKRSAQPPSTTPCICPYCEQPHGVNQRAVQTKSEIRPASAAVSTGSTTEIAEAVPGETGGSRD